ncbi:hypothetical protein ACIRU2_01145 [Streptomyces sp. NPDC101169]|uniref:hypothetical protein n=1 Tax=Streptomyces sp. NPDC101169 TaxID=3366121 RepID=UPI0038257150
MMKSIVKGGVMAATAAAVMIGFTAGPAAAATGSQKVSLPNDRGYMLYMDDGDEFTVCDTRADGYGVTGKLRTLNSSGTGIVTVFTLDDGGDANCDHRTYDIVGRVAYDMIVNWHGNNDWYGSQYFSES